MPDRTSLAHLAALTTGAARSRAGRTALTVLLEDADHLAELTRRDVLEGDTVIFAPAGTAPSAAGGPAVIGYRGGLGSPADQLWLDESFVMEVQSYAVSGFLAVHGPTLLRICGAEDLLALGADAVRARDHGRLPRIAASPLVHLADTPALGWPGTAHRSRRIQVRADGAIAVSATGSPVGTLDTLTPGVLARLAETGSGASTALRAAVDDADVERLRREVPWLSRYLAVVAAVRAARACGAQVDAVSGLGTRLDPRVPLEDGSRPADRPVIVLAADRALVVDPVTGRGIYLDLARATALERQLDGTGDPAGARFATALATRGFELGTQVAA